MKRDYWIISYRNFVALATLTALGLIVFALMPSFKGKTFVLIYLGVVLVIEILLGRMFTKKSPRAVIIVYILFGLSLAFNLFSNIKDPTTFDTSSILVYLIDIFIIDCARRAKKQGIEPIIQNKL